jgi:hypothetical protein
LGAELGNHFDVGSNENTSISYLDPVKTRKVMNEEGLYTFGSWMMTQRQRQDVDTLKASHLDWTWSRCLEEAGGDWREWSECIVHHFLATVNNAITDSTFCERRCPDGPGLPGNMSYEEWFGTEGDPWAIVVPGLAESKPQPEDFLDRALPWRVWARESGEPVPEIIMKGVNIS